MLYDPRWLVPAPTTAPTKPRERIEAQREVAASRKPKFKEPWRRILWDAAELIERKGWVQAAHWIPGEGYCAMGAILAFNNHLRSSDARPAKQKLRHHLRKSIHSWNDERGRTKEEVLTALRTVALLGHARNVGA